MFNVTGTTTIAAIASTNSWDGRVVTLIFAGALQLTHSSNLALPGSANITTAANDVATFVQTASGAWRLLYYTVATDNKTFQGSLTVNGNTTLGNANTDTVTTNGNVTANAPSTGDTVAISAISNRGVKVSGSTNPGYGVQEGVGSIFWMSAAATTLRIGGTGSTAPSTGALEIASTGAITANQPTAGVAFSAVALTGNAAIQAFAANGTSSAVAITQSGQRQWWWYVPASTSDIRLRDVDGGADRMTVDSSGNIICSVTGTAPTLGTNRTMSFELTSNTSLKIVVRGSDGTTRSTTLTLA